MLEEINKIRFENQQKDEEIVSLSENLEGVSDNIKQLEIKYLEIETERDMIRDQNDKIQEFQTEL